MSNSFQQNSTTEQIAKSINDLDNLLNSNGRRTIYTENTQYYIPINNVIQNNQISNENSQSLKNPNPVNLNRYIDNKSNENSFKDINNIPNDNSEFKNLNRINFDNEEKIKEIVRNEFENLVNSYKDDLKFNSNFLTKFEYDDGMNDVYKQISNLNNNIKNVENNFNLSLKDKNNDSNNNFEEQNKKLNEDLEKMYIMINNLGNEFKQNLDIINNKYQDENIILRAKITDLNKKINDLENNCESKNRDDDKMYVKKEEFDNKINELNNKIRELNKNSGL